MKILLLAFLVVSCQKSEEISPRLKEAWTVVNSPNDIYERHQQIENEIEMIDGQLSQTELGVSAVADLDNRKASAEQELKEEEKKVIGTQAEVEKASASEIKVLSSLGE